MLNIYSCHVFDKENDYLFIAIFYVIYIIIYICKSNKHKNMDNFLQEVSKRKTVGNWEGTSIKLSIHVYPISPLCLHTCH